MAATRRDVEILSSQTVGQKCGGNRWFGDSLLPKYSLLITVLHVRTVLVHLKSNLTKSLQLILWLYC